MPQNNENASAVMPLYSLCFNCTLMPIPNSLNMSSGCNEDVSDGLHMKIIIAIVRYGMQLSLSYNCHYQSFRNNNKWIQSTHTQTISVIIWIVAGAKNPFQRLWHNITFRFCWLIVTSHWKSLKIEINSNEINWQRQLIWSALTVVVYITCLLSAVEPRGAAIAAMAVAIVHI